MTAMTTTYLEVGSKRTFAVALEWPGWSRSGHDEASALQALLDYGKRYGKAISSARLGFEPPDAIGAFQVTERLKGDATTDYGTPGCIPHADWRPLDEAELRRLQGLLKACWRTFDHIAAEAAGRTLRLGARGGGRDLRKMLEHVRGAEHSYGRSLGVNPLMPGPDSTPEEMQEFRKAILQGIVASAHGELPKRGPRGGLRWPARYFVRRAAWHILDHGWEIEDRLE